MITKKFLGDETQEDPSLSASRETTENIDRLPRQFPARQAQTMPVLRLLRQLTRTGEHPPVRSTSTDQDRLSTIEDCAECPQQETHGETGAPYYGHDDEESVGSGV